MLQLPLLGVVKAAAAVSARTLTCRGPVAPRSCSMLSVYMAAERLVPRLPLPDPPAEAEAMIAEVTGSRKGGRHPRCVFRGV